MAAPMARFTEEDSSIGKFRLENPFYRISISSRRYNFIYVRLIGANKQRDLDEKRWLGNVGSPLVKR